MKWRVGFRQVTVWEDGPHGPMMVADCGISKSLSIDAKRRNARLMAAAPVMLELLEGTTVPKRSAPSLKAKGPVPRHALPYIDPAPPGPGDLFLQWDADGWAVKQFTADRCTKTWARHRCIYQAIYKSRMR